MRRRGITPADRLEVHEHYYVRGPNANHWERHRFDHSHPDGDTAHEHPDTGPAAFTIDKDAWYAATGLRGGGRKKYTQAPSGPQLPRLELESRTFRVVFCDEGLTPEHVRAGWTQETLTATRAEFRAAAAGQVPTLPNDGSPGTGGAAVARMALTFDLTPIYEYEDLRAPPRPRRRPRLQVVPPVQPAPEPPPCPLTQLPLWEDP